MKAERLSKKADIISVLIAIFFFRFEKKKGKIVHVIEEVVDLARQINLEVDSDDVQELLDSHNPGLTIDEFIEMGEQDIEELGSLDPVRTKDRMTVWNLTEGPSFIE
ncbi:hypothetical protein TNCV_4350931 [Trichonephila clavipes]|nr:hypothetical protein TNCV_4350931 [Trichonephila clavipes]